jgi:hypothetical protein
MAGADLTPVLDDDLDSEGVLKLVSEVLSAES